MNPRKLTSLFQFSIRSLLVAVTIAAVGVAALLNANVWWEAGTWLVALALLGSGILLSIYRQEEQRAFWLGFAIFGGLYLGLIVITAVTGPYYELAPSQLLQLAYRSVIPADGQSQYVPSSGSSSSTGSAAAAVSYVYTVVSPSPYSSSAVPPPVQTLAATPSTSGPTPILNPALYASSMPNPDYVPVEKFVSIGHSLWLLLAAAIGGKTCQLIYRRRPPT